MGHLITNGFIPTDDPNKAFNEGLKIAEEIIEFETEDLGEEIKYHGNFNLYKEKFETEEDAIDFFNKIESDGIVEVKITFDKVNDIYKNQIAILEQELNVLDSVYLNENIRKKKKEVLDRKIDNIYAEWEKIKNSDTNYCYFYRVTIHI